MLKKELVKKSENILELDLGLEKHGCYLPLNYNGRIHEELVHVCSYVHVFNFAS